MCPFSKYGQFQSHNKRSKEREREREREREYSKREKKRGRNSEYLVVLYVGLLWV